MPNDRFGRSRVDRGNSEAMSREFPDFLDPWKAADGRRSFGGTMPLARMRRLAALLAPEGDGEDDLPWEDARFQADFAYDAQGVVIIRLRVEASLPLLCQRSLLPYAETVRRDSRLAVVESLEEQDMLPGDYEPVLVEDGRMALLELVEDELLLAVPQVPRNPAVEAIDISTAGDEVAAESSAESEGPRQHPFADLGELLAKGKQH